MPMYDVSIKPASVEAHPDEQCNLVPFEYVSIVGNVASAGYLSYSARVTTYPQPSHLGLVGGCICKLEVFKDGVRVWSYDRGLYLGFLERGGREFLAALAAKFN